MTSATAKTYIREQIEIYERIRASFPALHPGDAYFFGYDIVNATLESLTMLYFVAGEIGAAQTDSDVQTILDDLLDEIRAEGVTGIEDKDRAISLICSIRSAIGTLYDADAGYLD